MFNVTGGELVIVFMAALVVLGPERLPDAARTVGKLMAQIRDVSQGFQRELKSALDEVAEPLQAVTRPQLHAVDGGVKADSKSPDPDTPDPTDKPQSAPPMISAVAPAPDHFEPPPVKGPEPAPGWATPPRPVLPEDPRITSDGDDAEADRP